MRAIGRGALLLAAALSPGVAPAATGAQQGFAGLWFQCQPKWQEQDNYLLVDVKPGEATWSAKWGVGHTASGKAEKDKQGALLLRGCHAREGKPAASCDPAKPPLFATLSDKLLAQASLPRDAALRRGAWLRTHQVGVAGLAAQCAALRPKAK